MHIRIAVGREGSNCRYNLPRLSDDCYAFQSAFFLNCASEAYKVLPSEYSSVTVVSLLSLMTLEAGSSDNKHRKGSRLAGTRCR